MTVVRRDEDAWLMIGEMQRDIAALQRLIVPEPLITDKRLPENPYDGQVAQLAMDSTGVIWSFRYNAGSASAYKWEFIDGSSLRVEASVGVDITSGTPALWTTGPILSLPFGGRYDVTFCAVGMVDSSTTYEAQARATLYTDTTSTSQHTGPKSAPGMPNDGAIYTPSVQHTLIEVASGTKLQLYVSLSRPGGAVGTARFASSGSYISVNPIRVA